MLHDFLAFISVKKNENWGEVLHVYLACIAWYKVPLRRHSDVGQRKVKFDDVLCSCKKAKGRPVVEILKSIKPKK